MAGVDKLDLPALPGGGATFSTILGFGGSSRDGAAAERLVLEEALKGARGAVAEVNDDDDAAAAAAGLASATTGDDSAPTRECATGLALDGAEKAPAAVIPATARGGGRVSPEDGVVATSPALGTSKLALVLAAVIPLWLLPRDEVRDRLWATRAFRGLRTAMGGRWAGAFDASFPSCLALLAGLSTAKSSL